MIEIIRKLTRFIADKDYRFLIMDQRGWLNLMSDRQHIRRMFHARMGVYPDLDNPKTFSEKLQWLKLHDRKKEYTLMVDKYEAKKLVAGIIGDEYIIPTYKVWNNTRDIDISDLPDQFVLKCTHDCGSLIICRNKSQFDLKSAKKKLKKCLKKNYYWQSREWPYKNVKPRIIAEKYMSDFEDGGLNDYKIHCLEGVPKIILRYKDCFSFAGMAESFFTSNWNHFDINSVNCINSSNGVKAPDCLDEMIELTRKISREMNFIRSDFYTIDNQVFLGELSFSLSDEQPQYVNQLLNYNWGDWNILPTDKSKGGVILHKNKCYLYIGEELEDFNSMDRPILTDYKFMCFNGKCKCSFVCTDRFSPSGLKVTFFDERGKRLPFERHYKSSLEEIKIPEQYEDMVNLSEKLSKGIPFVRVDFYLSCGQIYFGELTFFPGSGMEEFRPEIWDYKLGEWLSIQFN